MKKEYDVILADPPWNFKVWNKEKQGGRSISDKYSLMNVEDICALPVQDFAAENCALFMWATWPNIEEAFVVMKAWGFKYRTLGWDWVKAKKSGFGFHFGMGYYTRANTEPCLLAVKGKMSVSVHDISALIYTPVREHSRKPDEQYEKIEKLYPGMRYLELFARRKREGWDCFGNEVESDIVLDPDLVVK